MFKNKGKINNCAQMSGLESKTDLGSYRVATLIKIIYVQLYNIYVIDILHCDLYCILIFLYIFLSLCILSFFFFLSPFLIAKLVYTNNIWMSFHVSQPVKNDLVS